MRAVDAIAIQPHNDVPRLIRVFNNTVVANGTGIRVTEILPGTARTEFGETRWQGDKAKASAFYDGYETLLDAEDIARCVVFALEQPAHVVISELVIMPTSQW